MSAKILEDSFSPDAQTRQNATSQLESFADQNYPGYVTELANILASDTVLPIKQAAGAALRNSLTSKDMQKCESMHARWKSVDPATRSHVKLASLSGLASPVSQAGRVASEVVAHIAFIEIPAGEWPELVPALLEGSSDAGNDSRRAASLSAIGLMAEEIAPEYIRVHSNAILTAVVQGIRREETSEEVRIAAIKGLYNALGGIKDNFSREGERNYIMQVVCEATAQPSLNVQENAFMVLSKIMDLYYEYMELYMKQALFGLTVQGMKHTEERIAQQAIGFWCTVCDKELELTVDAIEAAQYEEEPEHECKQFAKAALPEILPVLLEILDKQDEDADDQDWTVSMAAALCLGLFAKAVGDDIVAPIIPFVERNIKSPNWRHREAAVTAFGFIIEGPDPSVLARLVEQALPTLIEMVKDPQSHVKETTVWALGEIALNLPETINPQTHLSPLLEAMVAGFQDSPKIISQCCVCLSNLAMDSGELIAPFYDKLVMSLTHVAERSNNDNKCRTAAYESLSALVQTSADASLQTTGNLAVEILSRIENLLNVQGQLLGLDDQNNWNELQSNLLNVITKITNRMDSEIKPLADRIMTLVLQLIQSAGKQSIVLEDAFESIGAIASAVGQDFENYLKAFSPFLITALKTPQDHQLCSIAISVVGDIGRALGERTEPYCAELIPILFENLASPNIHRSVKPPILSTFGDLALAIGAKYEIYLQHTMQVLNQVAIMQIEETTPLDFADFIRELRESILESYTGIITGFRSDQKVILLQPYLMDCFNFLRIISEDEADRSQSATSTAVGLLGDMADAFPNGELKSLLLQEWVDRLLKCGRAPGMSESARGIAKYARKAVTQATR